MWGSINVSESGENGETSTLEETEEGTCMCNYTCRQLSIHVILHKSVLPHLIHRNHLQSLFLFCLFGLSTSANTEKH